MITIRSHQFVLQIACFFDCRSKEIKADCVHILFNGKICIDRENLLGSLSATPISVCQMRKSLKLSVRVEF